VNRTGAGLAQAAAERLLHDREPADQVAAGRTGGQDNLMIKMASSSADVAVIQVRTRPTRFLRGCGSETFSTRTR